MVTGAMDMILTSEFGNATFCSIELKTEAIAPGSLILEAIYTINCPAPKYLQLPRYLPEASVRLLIDNNGRDLSQVLSHHFLNERSQGINKQTLQQLIQHARPHIQAMLEQAEKLLAPQQTAMIEEATKTMLSEAKDDAERLRTLAQVNPNIRAEEITQIETNADALAGYLEHARLKLDAIRVALVTA